MSKSGTIVIVDDDNEDRQIFRDLLEDLKIPNEVKWFEQTDEAFTYLKETEKPTFMIFCEVNVPGRNGLQFKKDIDNDPQLRRDSIPFIFMSSSATQDDVDEAYLKMTIQGFFSKGNDYNAMREMLQTIFRYWKMCRHPKTD